jgi:predicted ferric reductase
MSQNKPLQNLGYLILSVLSLMPLALWFLVTPISFGFTGLSFLAKSLGDLAGLCGMAIFSLVLILSARFKFFEKFFKGINESYTAHNFFGGLAFVLLLFHPLFLTYNYLLVSFTRAALFLLPSASNFAQNLGIYGLFVMIVTLAITFYTKLKYQVWKFTHKFLGLAFIFAFLHTMLIGADVASNIYLKIYLFALGALAIGVYFYRTLFADYLVRVFNYTVTEVAENKDKIWEITFKPKNREIKFIPGQFGFIKIFSKELSKEAHPFSFSSATGNPLKIAIKELGDYTNKIGSLKVGDLAKVEGPFGAFSYRNYSNPPPHKASARQGQIWIAGGVGITPFLSMIRSLPENHDYNIDLYYSVKDEGGLAFKEEIEEIAKNDKNFNVVFWVTSKDKFLTAKAISEKISDIKERDILICGPTGMMQALKTQFAEQGIEKEKVHAEDFALY